MKAKGYKACTLKKKSVKLVELIADEYEQQSSAAPPKPELKLTARNIFKTEKVVAGRERPKNPFF